jgi:hypothetical protein
MPPSAGYRSSRPGDDLGQRGVRGPGRDRRLHRPQRRPWLGAGCPVPADRVRQRASHPVDLPGGQRAAVGRAGLQGGTQPAEVALRLPVYGRPARLGRRPAAAAPQPARPRRGRRICAARVAAGRRVGAGRRPLGRRVVGQPLLPALRPIFRPTPARPPAYERVGALVVLDQPWQLAVDGLAPEGHQPVVQRVPDVQRLAHRGHLLGDLPGAQHGPHLADRPHPYGHTGRAGHGPRPRGEPEAVHQRA